MKPILRAASAFSVVFASALTLTIGLTPGDARAQAGARSYAVEGDCDGRPATGVRMAPGYCLGLVWQGVVWVFLLNCFCYGGLIWAIWRWKRDLPLRRLPRGLGSSLNSPPSLWSIWGNHASGWGTRIRT